MYNFKRLSTSLLLVILGGCSSSGSTPNLNDTPAYTPPAAGLTAGNTLEVEGITRHFSYYVPPNLPQDAAVLVLLHGGTQNQSRVVDGSSGSTGWLDAADQGRFLLLIPSGADASGDTNATSAAWNDCRSDATTSTADDVAFVAGLVDWVETQPQFILDAERIYAAGASNGGMMALRVALELNDRVAAVAAFIANNPANLDDDCALAVGQSNPDPVSVLFFNGTDDPLMPFDGGDVAFGAGGQVGSVEESVAFWRKRLGTSGAPTSIDYDDIDTTDGSTIRSITYGGGIDGAQVALYVVEGGGHTMPSLRYFSAGSQNHDLESAIEAWGFLSDKRL